MAFTEGFISELVGRKATVNDIPDRQSFGLSRQQAGRQISAHRRLDHQDRPRPAFRAHGHRGGRGPQRNRCAHAHAQRAGAARSRRALPHRGPARQADRGRRRAQGRSHQRHRGRSGGRSHARRRRRRGRGRSHAPPRTQVVRQAVRARNLSQRSPFDDRVGFGRADPRCQSDSGPPLRQGEQARPHASFGARRASSAIFPHPKRRRWCGSSTTRRRPTPSNISTPTRRRR